MSDTIADIPQPDHVVPPEPPEAPSPQVRVRDGYLRAGESGWTVKDEELVPIVVERVVQYPHGLDTATGLLVGVETLDPMDCYVDRLRALRYLEDHLDSGVRYHTMRAEAAQDRLAQVRKELDPTPPPC